MMAGNLVAIQNDRIIITTTDSGNGLTQIVFACFFCLVNLEAI
jgi:hypothetical protein